MSLTKRFIVVSTGQNVANLPPILEFGQAGDRVVWIESPEARRGNWSQGARGVLRDCGFEIALNDDIDISQINDPSQIRTAIQAAAMSWHPDEDLFIVANGGQKLTPIGLYLALQKPHAWFLYGNDRPVEWQKYPVDFGRSPERGFYQKHRLDLPDILRVTGHTLSNPEQRPFWPGELPSELCSERYGVDGEFTRALHHDRWQSHHDAGNVPGSVRYRELEKILSDETLSRWQRNLPALPGPDGRDYQNHGQFSTIYHLTVKLAELAARTRVAAPTMFPDISLGDCFENAVARRVHAWLESSKHPAIQSVWRNVVVLRSSGQHFAELDVVLVLKNGVLIHLECKSADVVPHEIDSRIIRLQNASSQLAKLAICSPCYTAFAKEPWFRELHAIRTKLIESGAGRFPILRFTLPNQSEKWACQDTAGAEHQETCPMFEIELERLLEKICGPAGSSSGHV